MIQRIQTLYLFGALILSILLIFVPFISAEGIRISLSAVFENSPYVQKDAVLYASVMNSISAFLLIVSILMYKNTRMQIRMVRIVFLLFLALMAVMFLLEFFVQQDNDKEPVYEIGIYFPIAACVFIYLAIKGIKRDYELVRSADRIR